MHTEVISRKIIPIARGLLLPKKQSICSFVGKWELLDHHRLDGNDFFVT